MKSKFHHQAAHHGSFNIFTLDNPYVSHESIVPGCIRLATPRKRGSKEPRSSSPQLCDETGIDYSILRTKYMTCRLALPSGTWAEVLVWGAKYDPPAGGAACTPGARADLMASTEQPTPSVRWGRALRSFIKDAHRLSLTSGGGTCVLSPCIFLNDHKAT